MWLTNCQRQSHFCCALFQNFPLLHVSGNSIRKYNYATGSVFIRIFLQYEKLVEINFIILTILWICLHKKASTMSDGFKKNICIYKKRRKEK